ncbi:hypothetical protein FXO38_01969 [Capsicum annuum]|nr:hypothetical protein FXO38_01969 [Capsicum annuum]KAF3683131.1 hypothetical protein FXO37_02020 [Capsicum annuum]
MTSSSTIDDDTSILIHILYDDARNYGFNGSIINAPRWRGIIDEFWSKSGKKDIYDEQQIKSKYNRLRTDTKNFKELLLNYSGYGWDPVTNTGKHMVYSTASDSPQRSNKPTRVDKKPFSCDDNPDGIGPMHITSSGTRIGKRTMTDSSMTTDGGTSILRKRVVLQL